MSRRRPPPSRRRPPPSRRRGDLIVRALDPIDLSGSWISVPDLQDLQLEVIDPVSRRRLARSITLYDLLRMTK